METGAEGARFFVWRKKPSSLFWEHKLMGLRPETIFRGGQQSARSGHPGTTASGQKRAVRLRGFWPRVFEKRGL